MKNIQTFESYLNEADKNEKWQVIFNSDYRDDSPYTLEY